MAMPRLDLSVAVYKLNPNPNARKVVQKKRMFALDKQRATVEDVDKLKITGFIREM